MKRCDITCDRCGGSVRKDEGETMEGTFDLCVRCMEALRAWMNPVTR